jgi:hypothetical protein
VDDAAGEEHPERRGGAERCGALSRKRQSSVAAAPTTKTPKRRLSSDASTDEKRKRPTGIPSAIAGRSRRRKNLRSTSRW